MGLLVLPVHRGQAVLKVLLDQVEQKVPAEQLAQQGLKELRDRRVLPDLRECPVHRGRQEPPDPKELPDHKESLANPECPEQVEQQEPQVLRVHKELPVRKV